MKIFILLLLTLSFCVITYSQIPTEGLVGYWPLNGNANDESGNGNNGTVYGATLTIDRFGNANHAYHFDGTSYIDCGDPNNNILDLGTNATINAWINIDETGNGIIVGKDESGGSYNKWLFQIGSDGYLAFHINTPTSGAGSWAYSNQGEFVLNNWYNVTVVKAGLNYTFYVNGNFDGTATNTLEVPDVNSTFMIGRAEGLYFKGILDDIRIYNRSLSQAEIDSLYNEGGWPSNTQWLKTNGINSFGLSFAVSGTNLFAGTYGGGVFLSTDSGTNWSAVNTGLTNTNVGPLVISGTNLFAGTDGGVFLSTNNGTSWSAVNTDLTDTYIRALAISGTNLFAGANGGGVFLSTNNGTSWSAVNTGLTDTYVNVLVVSGTNLFAGTDGDGVFLSTNNGTSWSAANTGLTDTYIRGLAISGTNLFAGNSDGGVFLSTNNGTSWSPVGLTSTTIWSLAFSGTNLFAGGSGAFLSTNNGTSWSAVNAGLTDTSVYALAVIGTNLFAGTNGGVWRRPLSEMITRVEDKHYEVPLRFVLQQNFPNPFNPTTVITYELPASGFVTLRVYDILGREVKVLVSEHQNAGSHSVTFNASNLPSEVYFYRLQSGALTETKKLVLLR